MTKATDIEERAAAWIARSDARGSDADAQLAAWLSADPRHRAAYLRLAEAWARTERLGRLRRLVEGIFFLPVILSLGTIGLIWSWMLDPQYGVINSIFHLTTFWTGSYRFAMPTVAVVTIWWSAGFNMLLYEAGLSSIPKEISEAARIDGATTGQVFRYITLPLLKPTTTLILILQLIASMNIFGQVYLLTGGGPNNSTRVLLEYMYTVAFTKQEGGYGSAIAVGIFVIILVISVIQYTVLNAGASAASRA